MFKIDAAANFERLYEPETRLRIQRQPGFPTDCRLPIETAAGFRYLRHAAGMNSRSIG